MTDGYLSKDREYLAKLQRQRRARMVRIDYMPSDDANDAIEAMRARSRPGTVSATNSAVIDALVAEWARLTGINKSPIEKPKTSAKRPELSDQYARAHITSDSDAECAHARAGASTAIPELPDAPQARAGSNNFGSTAANRAGQARVICGAKRRRDGQPCQGLSVPGKRRCKWHGGASTGPRTDEGRARSIANLRQYRNREAYLSQ